MVKMLRLFMIVYLSFTLGMEMLAAIAGYGICSFTIVYSGCLTALLINEALYAFNILKDGS